MDTLEQRIADAFERQDLNENGNALIEVNDDDLTAIVDALEIAANVTNESPDAEPEVFSPAYRARRRGLLAQWGVDAPELIIQRRETVESLYGCWQRACEAIDPGIESQTVNLLSGVAGYLREHPDDHGLPNGELMRRAANWNWDADDLPDDLEELIAAQEHVDAQ